MWRGVATGALVVVLLVLIGRELLLANDASSSGAQQLRHVPPRPRAADGTMPEVEVRIVDLDADADAARGVNGTRGAARSPPLSSDKKTRNHGRHDGGEPRRRKGKQNTATWRKTPETERVLRQCPDAAPMPHVTACGPGLTRGVVGEENQFYVYTTPGADSKYTAATGAAAPTGGLQLDGRAWFEADVVGTRERAMAVVRHESAHRALVTYRASFPGKYHIRVTRNCRRFPPLESLGETVNTMALLESDCGPVVLITSDTHPQAPSTRTNAIRNTTATADIAPGHLPAIRDERCSAGDTRGRYIWMAPGTPCRPPWCTGDPFKTTLTEGWIWVPYSGCHMHFFDSSDARACFQHVAHTPGGAPPKVLILGDSIMAHNTFDLMTFIDPRKYEPAYGAKKNGNWDRSRDFRVGARGVDITFRFNGHVNPYSDHMGITTFWTKPFPKFLARFAGASVIIVGSAMHDAVASESISGRNRIRYYSKHLPRLVKTLLDMKPKRIIWKFTGARPQCHDAEWGVGPKSQMSAQMMNAIARRVITRILREQAAYVKQHGIRWGFWDAGALSACMDGVGNRANGLHTGPTLPGSRPRYRGWMSKMASMVLMNMLCSPREGMDVGGHKK